MTNDSGQLAEATRGEILATKLGPLRNDGNRIMASSNSEANRLQAEILELNMQENGLLHIRGFAVVLGLASDSYGLTRNQLLLSSEDPNGEDHWYPLATLNDPSLTAEIGQADNIDYSHGALTTLSEAGIDLTTLPHGRYTVGFHLERSDVALEQVSLKAPIHEQWTLSDDKAIGSISDGNKWRLYSIPLPGRTISDAYFEISELEVREKRLYLQGYFVPYGKDFATWKSIDYSLSLIPTKDNGPRVSMSLANGNRPNAHELTGERWRDQSKAYFATYNYAGIDLTAIVPGEYELWISGRTGDDVFCRPLGKTLKASSPSNRTKNTLPEVSIIGSCVTRDNFNSSISPYWKSLWQLNSTFYQSSIVSLMSDPVVVPASFMEGLNPHDKEVVSRDLSKSFLNELIQTPPDILIVDLFADTRFGAVEIGTSWATSNDWKLPHAAGYKALQGNKRINGCIDEDEYMRLFIAKCIKLKEFIDEHIPDTIVCLNSARNVYIHRGINVESRKFSRSEMDRLNKLWGKLDEQFASILKPIVLDSMPPGIQADSHHQWGPGPVHYESRYYSRFHTTLTKNLAMDTSFTVGN